MTTMKTKIFLTGSILFSIVLFSSAVFAQPGGMRGNPPQERKDKIEAYKIAFITDKLQLTPQEAQKFWPVYNEYEAKRDAIRKKVMDANHNYRESDPVTDQQANDLIEADLKDMQSNLDLAKEYYGKLKAVLPPQKIVQLIQAEKQFRRELLERLADKQHPKPR
jgi:hypothetical protein